MATHLSILVWKIPWTEETGRLQSKGLQKSQTQLSNWARARAHTHTHTHTPDAIRLRHLFSVYYLPHCASCGHPPWEKQNQGVTSLPRGTLVQHKSYLTFTFLSWMIPPKEIFTTHLCLVTSAAVLPYSPFISSFPQNWHLQVSCVCSLRARLG